MLTNIINNPTDTILFLIAIIIAVTIHEYAHAKTAFLLGDPTPQNQGRITLNPLKHLDITGSIFFILAGFGWGKPVITNPYNYRRPAIDYAITSIAGPVANLLLAIVASLPGTIYYITGNLSNSLLLNFFEILFQANLLLFVFNLIPIYPLDGSKVIMAMIKSPVTLKKYLYWGPKVLVSLLVASYFFPIIWWPFIIFYSIPQYLIRGIPVSIFS